MATPTKEQMELQQKYAVVLAKYKDLMKSNGDLMTACRALRKGASGADAVQETCRILDSSLSYLKKRMENTTEYAKQ